MNQEAKISHITEHWRVFIDENDVIYDASLNQTNSLGNNNKFYRIQLLERKTGGNYHVWTRWGRVGESGAHAKLGDGTFKSALKEFNKKFKDKCGLTWENRLNSPRGGKYVFIERSYEPDSDTEDKKLFTASEKDPSSENGKSEIKLAASKLSPPVQYLMELIFNRQFFKEVMADLEYDADKLPLGKLSKRTLEQGYTALKVSQELFDLTMSKPVFTGSGQSDFEWQSQRDMAN
jgi:poly [ADP-ribose] polymerase 2/3/4